MEKPRGTKLEEFPRVLELINKTFRINRGCEPTMEQEFPLLLTKTNVDNMRIIEKNGEPVSCVNFMKRNVLIQGAEVLTASIGAVCTSDEYRGRGYSSLILNDVESKMEMDGVHVALVSGTRSLYQRRGFTLTKNFIKYEILPENIELKFELEEFHDNNLIEVARLFNLNSTRYVRSMDDFQKLINSALFPWGNISYRKYFIMTDGIESGYILIKLIHKKIEVTSGGNSRHEDLKEGVELALKKEKLGVVVEASGRADYIENGLKYIAYENGLKSIEYKVHIKDRINYLHKFDHRELAYQEGAVKIMNFVGFMEKLRPYFANYVTSDILNEIKFEVVCDQRVMKNSTEIIPSESREKEQEEKNDKNEDKGLKDFKFNVTEEILDHIEVMESGNVYRIIYKDEMLEVNDIWTLNKLVFEGGSHLKLNFSGNKQLESFIGKVFPIPFIYTANLNYQ